MTEWLQMLWAKETALMVLSSVLLGLLAFTSIGMLFDSRTLKGVNVWLKPSKFLLSTTIFLVSVAWLLTVLPLGEGWRAVFRWSFFGIMAVEMGIVLVQAARGVGSHFNETTVFDGALFGLMGILITLNTFLMAALAVLSWSLELKQPALMVWAIRLGLLLFVLGSLEGYAMIANRGHKVGVPDSSAGLPLLNWSIRGGDLRIAHFVGLHGLQVIPLLAWSLLWLSRTSRLSASWALVLLFVGSFLYLGISVFFFVQALAGQPLIPLIQQNVVVQPVSD
ncbi:MAG: hypothetical protein AAGJ35_04190 [Myxococcota bacterium]